uniref:Uncharacterized protein n=1 Tax=Labrus bergylta TaxID=56723 RepID=A0A3Q3F591_9LABR
METQSQANSAAEKKKRVETIVATKGSSVRNDISEKAVASSTTSNGTVCKVALAPCACTHWMYLAIDISWTSALKAISCSSRGTGFGRATSQGPEAQD